MRHLLVKVDGVRQKVSPLIAPSKKSTFGQFMTPAPVARFMAASGRDAGELR